MASEVARVSPELQHEVEQWYYEEARLLDERRYQSWLALVDPAIRYVMPGRGNPLVDNAMRGDEAMISVERELEDEASDGTPIRDETYAYLALRVERSFKPNAWAENPPARTRRLVGNVQVAPRDDGALAVTSAFHLHYARPGVATCFYAGQRRDVLVRTDAALRLARRVVVMDFADVEVPTLGLFL